MKRYKMSRGQSRGAFRDGARTVHPKNTARPMRGGIRL